MRPCIQPRAACVCFSKECSGASFCMRSSVLRMVPLAFDFPPICLASPKPNCSAAPVILSSFPQPLFHAEHVSWELFMLRRQPGPTGRYFDVTCWGKGWRFEALWVLFGDLIKILQEYGPSDNSIDIFLLRSLLPNSSLKKWCLDRNPFSSSYLSERLAKVRGTAYSLQT